VALGFSARFPDHPARGFERALHFFRMLSAVLGQPKQGEIRVALLGRDAFRGALPQVFRLTTH
jgi:hypothetical protein